MPPPLLLLLLLLLLIILVFVLYLFCVVVCGFIATVVCFRLCVFNYSANAIAHRATPKPGRMFTIFLFMFLIFAVYTSLFMPLIGKMILFIA